MIIRNFTTFPVGTKMAARRPAAAGGPAPGGGPRRHEMTVIVRACYRLAPGEDLTLPEGLPHKSQGFMTADTYRDDDDERAGECLYPGDFVDWKPRAEVLLRGTCHTPGGKPLPECPVRFEVGRWSKILRVVGRRFWSDDLAGAVMSEPAPFTKMPLGYTHAFGGAGYAKNPVGRGFDGRELPNVEHAGAVIRARRDDPGPAGFGALNPAWPPRSEKLGKDYGPRWRKERWPSYAEDFDFSYFNAAPPDQWLDGFLRGDETLLFQNMHPKAPILEARLPGIRARAFVKDVKQRFREVPMRLDTLFADLDKGKIYLTWRGLDAIETDDMMDVQWLLIGSEKLGDNLPDAHWKKLLEEIEADPRGLKHSAADEQIERLDALEKKLEELRSYKPPPRTEPAPDPVTGALQKQVDLYPFPSPEAREAEKQVAAAVAEMLAKAPPQANLSSNLADAIAAATKDLAMPAPLMAASLSPNAPPPAWVGDTIRKGEAGLRDLRSAVAGYKLPADAAQGVSGGSVEAFAALKKQVPADSSKQVEEALDQLEESLANFRKDPLFKAALDRPLPREPGSGKDLSAQDYAGRDLRGVDLSGVDLHDTNFTGANLGGAKLRGANLNGAVLVQADLTGADLGGANLTLANMTSVRAKGASLRGATLDRALFQKADLSGAVLADAKGELALFTESNLAGADAKGISLQKALFMKSNLGEADFSGAELEACNFMDTDARKATFTRATLTRSGFLRSDLRGAALVEARGDRTVWLQAKLEEADFTRAALPRAEFQQASAERARFRRAILKESRFYRASLEQADLSESNLLGADFSKAALGGARFTGSNLYGATFRQAAGDGCDFSGANLKRAMMESA